MLSTLLTRGLLNRDNLKPGVPRAITGYHEFTGYVFALTFYRQADEHIFYININIKAEVYLNSIPSMFQISKLTLPAIIKKDEINFVHFFIKVNDKRRHIN